MIKNQKKFDIITIGGATRDIMFYTKKGQLLAADPVTKEKLLAFEYGAKINADKLFFSFGGGAANTAATFSALGLKTGVVCRVGNDDSGKAVIKNFQSKNIVIGRIKIDRKNATGFSVILTLDNQAHEHIVFTHRGANNFINSADLPSSFESDWLFVSSLPKDYWTGIMEKIIKSGKSIGWNPGGYQIDQLAKMKKFMPKIKVFFVNRSEAMEFRKLKDIKGLLKYIKELGPEIVVITDGAQGAYVYDGKKYYFMKAKPIKTADTVGVGDAFSAAFTSALIYGKNIRTALEWGIKNSASVVFKIGAQSGILNKRQISK